MALRLGSRGRSRWRLGAEEGGASDRRQERGAMGPAWKLQRGEVLRGEGEDEERLRVRSGLVLALGQGRLGLKGLAWLWLNTWA